MELTVQNVYGLLLRSKLLSFEDARAMFARWNEESKEKSSDLAQFAAWMVSNRYVTEYQARLLAGGHADGFFLGGYMVLDRIGKGRMAGVYKARHPTGQVVAIKVLPPSKAQDPMLLGRFQREAKLALMLTHPNIVRGFQVGKEGNLHFLVMEYLEGETLEDALTKKGKYPPEEAVRIVYQALQGLQHIHDQGLVHRDLKPSNLMLLPGPKGPTVKILDIGLGRMLDEGLDGDAGLTAEGVLLGTPDYMAPEQARDARAIDIRADIYSLGCVLYHLLAGQPPFPDTNIISQMIRHASEPPRPVAQFSPGVPDGLQQILSWMMAKAPDGRYPTPARAAEALGVFLAAGAEPVPTQDPGMKKYLDWLEKEKKPPPPSGSALPAAPPQPPPAKKPSSPSVPAAAPALPAKKEGRGEEKRAAKARKAKGAGGAPPPPPPASPREPAAEEFDVELVAPPEPAILPGGLTRRDLAFFLAGGGFVTVAYFLGWGVAALLRRKPPPEPEVEEEKDPS
jgi:serine/threonine protein kinase